jgi:hypothetical protein
MSIASAFAASAAAARLTMDPANPGNAPGVVQAEKMVTDEDDLVAYIGRALCFDTVSTKNKVRVVELDNKLYMAKIDITQLMTGKDNKQASDMLRKLSEDAKAEMHEYTAVYQFPGSSFS